VGSWCMVQPSPSDLPCGRQGWDYCSLRTAAGCLCVHTNATHPGRDGRCTAEGALSRCDVQPGSCRGEPYGDHWDYCTPAAVRPDNNLTHTQTVVARRMAAVGGGAEETTLFDTPCLPAATWSTPGGLPVYGECTTAEASDHSGCEWCAVDHTGGWGCCEPSTHLSQHSTSEEVQSTAVNVAGFHHVALPEEPQQTPLCNASTTVWVSAPDQTGVLSDGRCVCVCDCVLCSHMWSAIHPQLQPRLTVRLEPEELLCAPLRQHLLGYEWFDCCCLLHGYPHVASAWSLI